LAPAAGEPTTKVVGGVSQTYCAKCRRWTKGAKEHTTAAHRSSRGAPPPAGNPAPVVAPIVAPPAAAIGATGALLPAEEEVEYTGGRLTFNGGLFVGGVTGGHVDGEPAPDPPVSFEDPAICTDDLFLSDTYRRNQGPEEFHDAISTQEAPAPASAPPTLPVENNDDWSSSGASDDEPPPGQCPNWCRQYGWLANLCGTCEDSGFIFEPIPDNAVFEGQHPGEAPTFRDDEPAGRSCPNCRGYVSVATLCENCEDSGFVFEPIVSGDEDPSGSDDDDSIEEEDTELQ
jgi:hypothetical protein